MIQAVPTLQVRGSCMAQKIASSAIQSGRNALTDSGNGMIESIRPSSSVTMTGVRRDETPLLIGCLRGVRNGGPDQHHLANLVESGGRLGAYVRERLLRHARYRVNHGNRVAGRKRAAQP